MGFINFNFYSPLSLIAEGKFFKNFKFELQKLLLCMCVKTQKSRLKKWTEVMRNLAGLSFKETVHQDFYFVLFIKELLLFSIKNRFWFLSNVCKVIQIKNFNKLITTVKESRELTFVKTLNQMIFIFLNSLNLLC